MACPSSTSWNRASANSTLPNAETVSVSAAFAFAMPMRIEAEEMVNMLGAARAYQAACTPDFFLFDKARRLVYRGQFDDSRPGNGVPVTGKDLRAALEAVLAGQPVSPQQKPSLGCNIKWKPGNEPDYFRDAH